MSSRTIFLAAILISQTARAEPPDASVKARKGPIEIRLDVLKTHIKEGEPVYVRIALANHSKHDLEIADWIYRGNDNLKKVWRSHPSYGTYIEASPANGKDWLRIGYQHHGNDSPIGMTWGKAEQPDPRIAEWKKNGISDREIDQRLQDEEEERQDAIQQKKYPPVILKPEKTALTVALCTGDGQPIPTNPGDSAISCPRDSNYVEIPFIFPGPGKYKLRAVYNHILPYKLKNAHRTEWDLKTSTPWIFIEVPK